MEGTYNGVPVTVVFAEQERNLNCFKIQNSIRLPFVQRVLGTGRYRDKCFAVLERIEIVRLEKLAKIKYEKLIDIFSKICHFLQILNDQEIVYHSIKSRYILITPTMEPNLTGFVNTIALNAASPTLSYEEQMTKKANDQVDLALLAEYYILKTEPQAKKSNLGGKTIVTLGNLNKLSSTTGKFNST
jgi:hypothetical protein